MTDHLQLGVHSMEGIYVISGRPVNDLANLISTPPILRIPDITATILHALGVPVPDYMAGTPLTNVP